MFWEAGCFIIVKIAMKSIERLFRCVQNDLLLFIRVKFPRTRQLFYELFIQCPIRSDNCENGNIWPLRKD